MTQTPMPDTTLTSAELDELERAFDDASPKEEIGAFLGTGAWASAGDVASFRRLISLARSGLEARKAEESMRERAALEAEGIGEAYGMDETGWAECSETVATAIRALPLTGDDKP